MANTVNLITDHLGSSRPRVQGTEYVVDAYIVVTTVTAGGEPVDASDFGLTSISQVILTGNSLPSTYDVDVEVSATGAYESSTQFKLIFTSMDGTNAVAEGNITDTTIRVRVIGQIGL